MAEEKCYCCCVCRGDVEELQYRRKKKLPNIVWSEVEMLIYGGMQAHSGR